MLPAERKWLEGIWAAGAAGSRPDWADVEWYAADGHDCVGMFTSAGPGPIPLAGFRDLDAYLALPDCLRTLPELGEPELLARYNCMDDFRRAAARGLFAFNFEDSGASPPGYRLVARPVVPLALGTLPVWAQELLRETCLPKESFVMSAGRVVDLSSVRPGLVSQACWPDVTEMGRWGVEELGTGDRV
jgi:hypothetical protein